MTTTTEQRLKDLADQIDAAVKNAVETYIRPLYERLEALEAQKRLERPEEPDLTLYRKSLTEPKN